MGLVRALHETMVQTAAVPLQTPDPAGQPAPHVREELPLRVYPVLQEYVMEPPYDTAAVVEIEPDAGAARPAHDVSEQPVTPVQAPLDWHVLVPPPQ